MEKREIPFIFGKVQKGSLEVLEMELRDESYYNDDKGNSCFIMGQIYSIHSSAKGFDSENRAKSLLQAYKNLGCEVFPSIDGEFSAVVWDQENSKLVLVRDKLGLGFMYYRPSGNALLFSNKLGILIEKCKNSKIKNQSILEFFQLGVILPPNTILEDIYSLEPGSYIQIDKHNECSYQRYFDFSNFRGDKIQSREILVKNFYKNFKEAVAKRIEGFEKIGVFLSGGIDSGALLSVAKRLGPDKDFYAFTVGPWGEGSSDLPYARINAEYSEVTLEEFYGAAKILSDLPEVLKLLGQPNSDTSALTFHSMGLEAKRKGVELMLCGQNADTMFGAIPYVKTLKRCGDLHKMTAPIKPLLKVASSILPATYKSRASFIVNYDLPRSFLWLKTGFYRDPPHSPRYTWLRGDFYETVDEKNLLNKIKAFEIDLDGDIADRLILFDERYTEAPRCVEAIKKPASVETMLPYYDETLIRTALQVPTKYRAESSWDKMILRDAFKPVVHPLIYKRPMKSLVFPLFKWLEPEVLCNIKGDEFIENIVDLDFLVRERKNVKELLWAEVVFKTLVLFVWYDVFFSKGTVSKKILKSIFK